MPVSRENLRMVLVENDPDDLFFLERALDKAGFTLPPIHLGDGMEATRYFTGLETTEAELPDLVLTDLKMPRLTGTDLLQWLRDRPKFKDLPVIVLTSSNESVDIRATTRLGIYKFITKQVRYENVIGVLNQFIMASNIEARR